MLHITITNLETGEIHLDADTNAVIGSYCVDDESSMGFSLADKASAIDLFGVIDAARDIIENTIKENKAVAALDALSALKRLVNSKNEETEEETGEEES